MTGQGLKAGVMKAFNRHLALGCLGIDQGWRSDFSFVQAADCQLGMAYQMDNKDYSNCTWEKEMKWCNTFVSQINALHPAPRFAIICGDLVDAMPHQWKDINTAQRKDFKEVMSQLNVPLVCVCGNHDLGNTPTTSSVQSYRDDFGDDFFSFSCGGVYFIVLNSQFYEEPSQVQDMAAEQDAWLEQQLKIVSSGAHKHSVVFQHIPWFLESEEEEKQYFNISQPLRRNMLNKLCEAGVSKIFCGHYHRNAGGWYKDMELIVTSSLGAPLGEAVNGFRIVRVTENDIQHEYVNLTEY